MTYTCILVMEVISLENSVAVLLLCSQVVAMDLLDREVAMFLKKLQMLENQSSYTEEKFRNLQRLLRRIASFVKPN
ncbi:uncharacterized protein LOC110036082 isoform X3 [Phalaenopsis equestris]|uniref:uncharacterized protein LOC110036082 isoform X3 n=1 Tax=Phalaenopsis equestris TaxID=78828 RepID=UPI0009E61FE0|nr:uncharacterized protein LOC110036082 isoform X3 [Phalaenopsis equestris]